MHISQSVVYTHNRVFVFVGNCFCSDVIRIYIVHYNFIYCKSNSKLRMSNFNGFYRWNNPKDNSPKLAENLYTFDCLPICVNEEENFVF